MSSQTVNKYEVPLWRVLFIYGLIIGVVGVMTYRLVALQVVGPQAWLDQSVDNYQQTISDPAPRGIIYDRHGFILARNVASYNVVITPAALPDDQADIQRIYREVSELTGVPAVGLSQMQPWLLQNYFLPVCPDPALRIWWRSAICWLLTRR